MGVLHCTGVSSRRIRHVVFNPTLDGMGRQACKGWGTQRYPMLDNPKNRLIGAQCNKWEINTGKCNVCDPFN